MTITFVVRHLETERRVKWILGLIPVDDVKVFETISQYKLNQEFESFDSLVATEEAVTKMLSDFYGNRLISVKACDFGPEVSVVEFSPLADGTVKSSVGVIDRRTIG